METVERDFSPKGVKFFYVYKSLAHPENNGFVAPLSLKERLLHIAEAKRQLQSRITWLCDSLENDLKHALGDAPNSEFVIDPQGKLVVARRWSDPQQLRKDLEAKVGRIERATTIADLDRKPLPPPKRAPTGIVPRIELPDRLNPIEVEPLDDPDLEPYYVKLRAEADAELLQTGTGKLYLGFFLDPLYKVHWNNRAGGLRFEIQAGEGMSVTPTTGKSPDVEEDADADPREFLVELAGQRGDSLTVTVRYVACDDAETFCKPVTQGYRITLVRDRDGGSRRSSFRDNRRRPIERGPIGGRAEPGSTRRTALLKKAVSIFRQHDANGDGKLDRDEIANIKQPPLDDVTPADTDGDGSLSLRELLELLNEQTQDPR